MSLPRHSLLLSLVIVALPARADVCAQPRAALPRFEAESVQAQTRLNAIQEQLQPGTDARSISLLFANLHPTPQEILAALSTLQVHDDETWDMALDELHGLERDLGDKLVPLPDAPISSIPSPMLSVRRQIALIVAQWPRSMRERHYRNVDKAVAGMLQQALATRSEALLRRVVDEAAGSPSAARALDSLGDIAFFKGNLHEALSWWSLLAPLPTRINASEPPILSDAGVDYANLHARQVLALAYLGDLPEAAIQRDAFARLFPGAEGTLAGKKGPYTKTLDELLRRFIESGDVAFQNDWPTLGGNGARHAVVPNCPSPRLWVDGPSWKVVLPTPPKTAKKVDVAFEPIHPLYHPIIVGEQIILGDSQSVSAYHLSTGKLRFRHVFPEGINAEASSETPVYTVSAAQDLVVLRVGRPPERQAHLKKPLERTWLVGVDLRAEGNDAVRWKVGVPVEDRKEAFFNGPALIHLGKVWVPFQEWKGAGIVQGVASLNPETGRWLTTTRMGKIPVLPAGRETVRQPVLLTAAGSLIIACTQAGSVVALDNHTGAVAWALPYPSQGPWTRLTTASVRDLAAPLFALDRVYVAPQDTDLILCLDPQTGRVLWEREILDVAHLLGCCRGKLIFTTSTGLRTVSSETGSDREGWLAPQSGKLSPQGRGLMLGEWIFWPTKSPMMPVAALSVLQGLPELASDAPRWDRPRPLYFGATAMRHLPAGNMAFGQDSLVIATDKELVGFISPRFLLEERKVGAERKKTPIATFLLAQSEADAGQEQAAFLRLRGLFEGGSAPWRELAQDRLHELLVERAEEASRTNFTPVAETLLSDASSEIFTPLQRAWALQRLRRQHATHESSIKRDDAWKTLVNTPEVLREYLKWGPRKGDAHSRK